METSGTCKQADPLAIAPRIQLFFFDCKETRSEEHRRFTGVSPERLLANLHALDEAGKRLILRCSLIPERNAACEEHYAGLHGWRRR